MQAKFTPAKAGNRIGADLNTEQTKMLGWKPTKSLEWYIRDVMDTVTINVNCAVIVVSLALCFWVEWVASLVSKSYMISFYSQTLAVHLVFVGSALVIGLLKRLKFSRCQSSYF